MDYTPIKINDPIWNYRKGTGDDQYVSIVENVNIMRNVAVLRERPDESTGVTITGFTPITKETFDQVKTLTTNQFFVDYSSNFVYFNPLINGQTLTISYMGTGYLLIDARRVILQSPNPYTLDNLQEYVDYITGLMTTYQQKLDGASDTVQNMLSSFISQMTEELNQFQALINEKVGLNDNNIKSTYESYISYVDAELQRNIAYINQKKQQFIDYINTYMQLANEKINEMNNDIQLCVQATNASNIATTACNNATATCITETNICKTVYNETMINYLPYVSQYSDLAYIYPFPQNGWTAATSIDNMIYRYSNISNTWEQQRKFQDIIPPVNSTISGLMTPSLYNKLGGIEAGAQVRHTGQDLKNDLPNELKEKDMIFFIKTTNAGIQPQNFMFDYAGQIVGIKALCSGAGNDYLDVTLERTTFQNYQNNTGWQDLLSSHLIIPANKKVNDNTFQFANTAVLANDVFRINIHYSNQTVTGLTIQVTFRY